MTDVVVDILVKDIEVGKRMRALDVDHAAYLADSIRTIGLQHPIRVRPQPGKVPYLLVTGRTRLYAIADLLQMPYIAAIASEYDDPHAELAEIDENLRDKALTALEQGEHLNRREELMTQLGLRAPAGGAGRPTKRAKKGAVDTEPVNGASPVIRDQTDPVTTAMLAAEAGLSERTAQYRKQAASGIAADVRDLIRGTAVADRLTDLLTLSHLPVKDQRRVAKLIASGKFPSVAAALRPASDEDDEPRAADNSERMNIVSVRVLVTHRVENPVQRKRGEKYKAREQKLKTRTFDLPGAPYEGTIGNENPRKGCAALWQTIGEQGYREHMRKGFPAPKVQADDDDGDG